MASKPEDGLPLPVVDVSLLVSTTVVSSASEESDFSADSVG